MSTTTSSWPRSPFHHSLWSNMTRVRDLAVQMGTVVDTSLVEFSTLPDSLEDFQTVLIEQSQHGRGIVKFEIPECRRNREADNSIMEIITFIMSSRVVFDCSCPFDGEHSLVVIWDPDEIENHEKMFEEQTKFMPKIDIVGIRDFDSTTMTGTFEFNEPTVNNHVDAV